MTTIPHETTPMVAGNRRRSLPAGVAEVGASVAMTVMWLAVMFDALFGPNIVTSSAGGDSSSVPSAVVVAFFAFLATWIVARYGFRRTGRD